MSKDTINIFDKKDLCIEITRDNTCGDTFLKTDNNEIYQIDSNTYDLIRHLLFMFAERRLNFIIEENQNI